VSLVFSVSTSKLVFLLNKSYKTPKIKSTDLCLSDSNCNSHNMVSLKIKGSLIVLSIFVLFMILNVGLAFGTVQESEAAVELN